MRHLSFKACLWGSILLNMYIYNISFVFLPLTCRKILAIFGIFIFILKWQQTQHYKRGINKTCQMFFWFISLIALSAVAGIFNGNWDTFFVSSTISFISNFFAAYFVLYNLHFLYQGQYRLNDLIFLCLITILSNNLLAFSASLSPGIYNILSNIQNMDSETLNLTTDNSGSLLRLFGLGENAFFNGGAYSCLGLLLATYLLFFSKSLVQKYLFLLVFILILVTGILIARTTLVGFLLSILFLFYLSGRRFSLLSKHILIFLSVIPISIGLFFFFIEYLNPKMLEWGLELIINYFTDNSVNSSSTNEMFDMWKIIPEHFSTYLTGDGQFNLPDGSYYMHVDIGILRILYFVGIPGLFLIFMIIYKLVFPVKLYDSQYKLSLFIWGWFITMNLKGFFFPLSFCLLLFIYYLFNEPKDHCYKQYITL